MPWGHSRRRSKCDLIEPNERVGPAQDEVAELALVHAVEHPTVGRSHHALDLPAERLRLRRHPPGLMHERVQLGERDVELLGEPPAEGRLAVAADAGDDDAARHRG
jgi:hypothetical protein